MDADENVSAILEPSGISGVQFSAIAIPSVGVVSDGPQQGASVKRRSCISLASEDGTLNAGGVSQAALRTQEIC